MFWHTCTWLELITKQQQTSLGLRADLICSEARCKASGRQRTKQGTQSAPHPKTSRRGKAPDADSKALR